MNGSTRLRNVLTAIGIILPLYMLGFLAVLVAPVALIGESIITLFLGLTYGKATAVSCLSLLPALIYAVPLTTRLLLQNRSLLHAAFRLSLYTNVIACAAFELVMLLTPINPGFRSGWIIVVFPVAGFLLLVPITTFSSSLLVSYLLRKQLQKTTEEVSS